MKTLISLHVTPALDAELRHGPGTRDDRQRTEGAVQAIIGRHRLRIQPLFTDPGASPDLIWQIRCDARTAVKVADELRLAVGVTAAYIAPDEGLPDQP